MGVYVITDGNGSFIRHDEGTGRYVPIRSLKHAKQWDSAAKAGAILKNSISSSIRSNYEVRLVETEQTVEKLTIAETQNTISLRPIEDDNIKDWLEKVNTIQEVLSGSGNRSAELNEKLSEIDKEISDVNHYIEFGNYNACQGWRCFKMLQMLLRQRRKYKNEIQVLQMIRDCRFDKDSLAVLSERIADVSNKCYHPRAFPDLFMNRKT